VLVTCWSSFEFLLLVVVECSDIWDKNMYLQDIPTFCHYAVQKLKRKAVTEWRYDI